MNRTKSREIAMKTLYANSLGGEYSDEIDTDVVGNDSLSEKDANFCNELIAGVKANEESIRDVIAEYSSAWSIDRIGRVELCILEIATFEILYLPDIPIGATINEAVELSKEYCDEKSPAFINGVLGSIGRKYRN